MNYFIFNNRLLVRPWIYQAKAAKPNTTFKQFWTFGEDTILYAPKWYQRLRIDKRVEQFSKMSILSWLVSNKCFRESERFIYAKLK